MVADVARDIAVTQNRPACWMDEKDRMPGFVRVPDRYQHGILLEVCVAQKFRLQDDCLSGEQARQRQIGAKLSMNFRH
jgi:hypothetical protein